MSSMEKKKRRTDGDIGTKTCTGPGRRSGLCPDNRGSAMVMVLLIVMFIFILAAILMFTSYLGYQMRLLDKQGKDTFYTAETVLDEINTGIQEEASKAMSEAYGALMQNYAMYDSTTMRSSEFYRNYIDNLKERLQGSAADGEYDISKFRDWLSDEVIGNEDTSQGYRASREAFLDGEGGYGAIVESNVTPEKYMLIKTEGESLLIKDLKVTYVDQRGYVSMISTDIRLVLPEVSFAQISELPSIEKFSLIADETLAMGNSTASGSVTIEGDAYAGRMTVGKTDENPAFQTGSKAVFKSVLPGSNNMALVINRENTVVNEGEFSTENAEFWGENIKLDASGAVLDGITNLKDDLILTGKESKAKLAGEYNGFSMNVEGNSASGSQTEESEGEDDNATNPALSSAIVINGRSCSLDLSGLDSMTIAGRSYVQTKTDTSGAGATVPAAQRNKANVMMSESVSVKSNQLIYLVPAEALGCERKEDGTIGDTVYGANPFTVKQYEEIASHPDKYVLIDGSKKIAALGDRPLSTYISQEKVAGQTQKAYMPEVIFRQTGGGEDSTLVYCYLRFTDEEKANQYFKDYYDVNYEQVDKYTRLYAKEVKMPDPASMLYLNLAGNMLVYDEGQTAAASMIAAPDDGKSSYYIKQRQAKTIYNTKTNSFRALSAKMVTDLAKITTVEQGRTAFDNVIDTAKMEDLLIAAGTSTLKIETGASGDRNVVIITREPDYVVDAATPDSSIIISTGNVQVNSSFNGLIIADQNITVTSAGLGLTISPLTLQDYSKMLNAEIEFSGTTYYVIDLFRDGVNYKSSNGTAGAVTEQVSLKDLIVYEQWSKK